MGIEKVEMYVCSCDNCGCDYISDDMYVVFPMESDADNSVRNDGEWIKEDGKYYCCDCYEYDEDDNLIISEERKKIKQQICYKTGEPCPYGCEGLCRDSC